MDPIHPIRARSRYPHQSDRRHESDRRHDGHPHHDGRPHHARHSLIDASHIYENVRQDVADWWPDVKVDGLLCGHDFSAAYPGVIRAISEFAVRERYQLNVENGDWWIEK